MSQETENKRITNDNWKVIGLTKLEVTFFFFFFKLLTFFETLKKNLSIVEHQEK